MEDRKHSFITRGERPASLQKGVGLLEVLIALVLISIGFLAVGRMQIEGMRYSQSAYNRSQAYFMANDIIDRMRANVPGVLGGHYDDKSTSSTYVKPDCTDSTCTPAELALQDLAEWRENLHPVTSGKAVLPSSGSVPAKGMVVANGDNSFTVNVTWAESETSAESLSVSFATQGADAI
ncbi:type IV pilus modification protein PilV [Granulosicoccus sp.]|nr:type IV pilus modification protein PilV [Granulosicoccus sp.]